MITSGRQMSPQLLIAMLQQRQHLTSFGFLDQTGTALLRGFFHHVAHDIIVCFN